MRKNIGKITFLQNKTDLLCQPDKWDLRPERYRQFRWWLLKDNNRLSAFTVMTTKRYKLSSAFFYQLTLAQMMVWCLTAPRHYTNKCWNYILQTRCQIFNMADEKSGNLTVSWKLMKLKGMCGNTKRSFLTGPAGSSALAEPLANSGCLSVVRKCLSA